MINKIKELEKQYNIKVLYLTISGSKLYGLDNENSDTDYKGIFIQDTKTMVLKKDVPFISNSTGKSNSKNTKDDIDFHIDSIQTFMRLLKKGETGAIDLLYSIFREKAEDTIVYIDDSFKFLIKQSHNKLYGKNMQSFIGYCVTQATRYGIKGRRFDELCNIIDILKENKSDSFHDSVKKTVSSADFKYVKYILAPGPKSKINKEDIEYFEVLGKKYMLNISHKQLLNKLTKEYDNIGNRAKASRDGNDWKSLSHAIRVIDEAKELLTTGKLQFPLQNQDFIRRVKESRSNKEEVEEYIIKNLDIVKGLEETSNIQDEQSKDIANGIILYLTKERDNELSIIR